MTTDKTQKQAQKRKRWSESDDKHLKEYWAEYQKSVVRDVKLFDNLAAESLGRTLDSVRQRRAILGLVMYPTGNLPKIDAKTQEQACREAFEAWYVDPDNPRAVRRSDTNPEGYALMQVQLSWSGWQAAWKARGEYDGKH